MLSKNLIKANQFVLKETEPRILDSNELVAKRLETIFPGITGGAVPGGFQTGLNAPEIDPLFEEEGEYIEGMEEELPPQPAYTGPSPEELIAQAQAEIDEMHKEAEKTLSYLKKKTKEDARKEGYEEGRAQAMQELEAEKAALQEERVRLENEYQQLIDRLEPEFIQTLTGIYEQIFQVELAAYQPVLAHTISNCIRHIEGGYDFLVHISHNDYEAVMKEKEELLKALPSQQATLELVEDLVLKTGECMIETSSGIYDCGIGTQLEELQKRLQLLSYEK